MFGYIASQAEIERVGSVYGLLDAKIARIFNPLDLSLWPGGECHSTRSHLGLSPQAEVVVCHGRIERYRKGLDILLEAWQQVYQNRPGRELRLLLVESGNDTRWLGQTIAEKSISNIVWVDEFVLNRTLVANYLSCADIYTLPSRHEGHDLCFAHRRHRCPRHGRYF